MTGIDVPRLETPRLTLRPLGPSDSAGMFELWSRPEVAEYSGPVDDWDGHPVQVPAVTPADSDRIIEFFVRLRAAQRGFRWSVRARPGEDFIGAAGFNAVGPTCELAFHQVPRHWGSGFMTEACEAAIRWAFDAHGATEVEAFADPANAASIRLLERLGCAAAGPPRDGAVRFALSASAD